MEILTYVQICILPFCINIQDLFCAATTFLCNFFFRLTDLWWKKWISFIKKNAIFIRTLWVTCWSSSGIWERTLMKKRIKSKSCMRSYVWDENNFTIPALNLYLLFDGKKKIYFGESHSSFCLEKGHHKGLTVNSGHALQVLLFLFGFCWAPLNSRLAILVWRNTGDCLAG